jgi:hypothetical protein
MPRRFRMLVAFAVVGLVSGRAEAAPDGIDLAPDVKLWWFTQGEIQSHQDSEDQLQQGGQPLNQDRALVRRMRLRLAGDWEYAAALVEIDGNTVDGPSFGLRQAEGSLHYRMKKGDRPLVQASIGLLNPPFGHELIEWPRDRVFMERSLASRAFWPGETDVGVRVSGALGFLRWSFAATNGEPLDARTPFPTRDPNSAKDVVFRVAADTRPHEGLRMNGGVSALRGKGFHPGTDATKERAEWRDANEDGIVQTVELTAVPALAALPSANFERWVLGADLQTSYRTSLGLTKVYGELMLAQNMDRGLYVSDPVATGIDARAIGLYAALVQEITPYGVVGFRLDYYDPNADVFDRRGGKLLPFSQAMTTYSPLAGFVLPDRAKLLFQYDLVRDALARDERGVPTDLRNDAWTIRLQVSR